MSAAQRLAAARDHSRAVIWATYGHAATHYVGGVGAGVALRVLRESPDATAEWNGGRFSVETTMLRVRASEAPAISRGDVFEIGAERLVAQGTPQRDADRLVWTVEARPE